METFSFNLCINHYLKSFLIAKQGMRLSFERLRIYAWFLAYCLLSLSWHVVMQDQKARPKGCRSRELYKWNFTFINTIFTIWLILNIKPKMCDMAAKLIKGLDQKVSAEQTNGRKKNVEKKIRFKKQSNN